MANYFSILLVLQAAFFCLITVSSYVHFKSDTPEPFGMKCIRVSSVFGFLLDLWGVSESGSEFYYRSYTLGLILVLFAFFVFFSALRCSGRNRLGIAFTACDEGDIIQGGVYSYCRHPFYLSYILFWMSWIFSNGGFLSIAVALIMISQYVIAIHIEEKFLIIRHPDNYKKYRDASPALLFMMPTLKDGGALVQVFVVVAEICLLFLISFSLSVGLIVCDFFFTPFFK